MLLANADLTHSLNEVFLQGWWMLCAALVLLMLYGFVLLESGWADIKHLHGITVKNVMMFLASSTAYYLIGYSVMYGDSYKGLLGRPFSEDPLYWSSAHFWFQTGFAAVSATIISGAIVGRTTLLSNVLAAFVIAGFIYPIHGHWIWHHSGWLHHDNPNAWRKVHDYAGSGVVHIVGGMAAFVGTCFAKLPKKPRLFGSPSDEDEQSPHLAAGGVLILAIGWIGFNGGSVTKYGELVSEVGGHSSLVVGKFVQYTILAAASGAMMTYICSRISMYWREYWSPPSQVKKKKSKRPATRTFDAFRVLSGTMAGMVAISACCNVVRTDTALYVGAFGGLVYFICSGIMSRCRRLDTVDAFAVHWGGGVAGLVSVGFMLQRLDAQMIDIALATTFTGLSMCAVCLILMHFPAQRDLLRAKGDWQGFKLTKKQMLFRRNLWLRTSVLSLLLAISVAAIIGKLGAVNVFAIAAALAPVIGVALRLHDKFPAIFRRLWPK